MNYNQTGTRGVNLTNIWCLVVVLERRLSLEALKLHWHQYNTDIDTVLALTLELTMTLAFILALTLTLAFILALTRTLTQTPATALKVTGTRVLTADNWH